MLPCRHLGPPNGANGSARHFQCRLPQHAQASFGHCLRCADFLGDAATDPRAQPSGILVRPDGRTVELAGLYRGSAAFAVLGGPSIRQVDFSLLRRRGVILVGVNNSPAVLPEGLRPHLWLHTDPCAKFHDAIFRDPSVLKFVPAREWGEKNAAGKPGGIRSRRPDGQIVRTGQAAKTMPGVIGYQRNTAFFPDQFLWEPSFNRGNNEKHAKGIQGVKCNGWPHVINTMFTLLRLTFYLGFERLYLLGCDWHMPAHDPYGFRERKHLGSSAFNNESYKKMDPMLAELARRFDKVGFEVFNCTLNSRLHAFPRRDLAAAIDRETAGLPANLDTKGWYLG